MVRDDCSCWIRDYWFPKIDAKFTPFLHLKKNFKHLKVGLNQSGWHTHRSYLWIFFFVAYSSVSYWRQFASSTMDACLIFSLILSWNGAFVLIPIILRINTKYRFFYFLVLRVVVVHIYTFILPTYFFVIFISFNFTYSREHN